MQIGEAALPEARVLGEGEDAWDAGLQPLGCAQCGQAHLAGSEWAGRLCPNCARGRLEAQPALLRAEPPELLVPFAIGSGDLPAILSTFVKPVWLRPADMDAEQMARRAMPVLAPMWLVDCDVRGEWEAEAGFDYQVKSSQEAYGEGGWQTREVIETRVRWEPRLGWLERHYANIAAPALEDHARLLRLIGEFRLDKAAAFVPRQAAGAAVRVPDLPPESAWPGARAQVDRAAAAECRTAAGAQRMRNYAIRAEYQGLHWTLLLLPLYATYYADDAGRAHPIYINGQSGQAGGVRLASQRKGWLWAGAAAAFGLVLLALGLLLLAAGALLPPAAVLGAIFLAAGFAAGALALAPAIWPWQWNRRQM